MAALFPFLSDYQAVFGAPVILLASFGVMFLLGILKSMPWSRFKISLNAYANGLSAVVLAQAVLLTCLFAAFHICETQEIVLIALVVVLLFGLMWQAIISNSVFIHVLRMPVGLSAVVAGGIALIGLVTGLYIWYQWIAADVLTWDYSFFT